MLTLACVLLKGFVMTPVKIKDVYIVTDFGNDRKISEVKIGVAFVCADDSLNVKLDAVPITGMLHIRDRQCGHKNKNKDKYEKNHDDSLSVDDSGFGK
jgi:hypothetical protein